MYHERTAEVSEPEFNSFSDRAKGNSGGWTPERQRRVPEYKQQIIEMTASGMFLSEISTQLDIYPKTIRKWRTEDKEFAEAFSDAEAEVTDTLEKEGIRRARDGVLEPVISQGKVVMTDEGRPLQLRRYSDSLMMFLLKGRRRETYGDKREVDAKVGIDMVGAKDSLAAKFAAAAAVVEGSE